MLCCYAQKYVHFIKLAADKMVVWGLWDDGWALASDDGGNQVFPLWPEPDYAELCAKNIWDGYQPEQISTDDLLEELIPQLRKDGIQCAIFYTPKHKGVITSTDQLIDDLNDELSKYE